MEQIRGPDRIRSDTDREGPHDLTYLLPELHLQILGFHSLGQQEINRSSGSSFIVQKQGELEYLS